MLCADVRPVRRPAVEPDALAVVRRILGGELRAALAEPPGPATIEVERLARRALEHHSSAACAAPRCCERSVSERIRAEEQIDGPKGTKGLRLGSPSYGQADLMDRVVNLAKRRGLVFPSSEIYGGFRSTWDYGPLGVLLKRNVKDAWWRSMVQLRDDIVGLDAAILMAPKVWEASGHLATFTDPLVDCRNCKERFRADQLPESGACPNCGAKDSFTEARQFNLMFKTYVGPVEDDAVGRVPAARDRAGHLRQLRERADDHAQEAAVRHRADRQVVPQRDHARATSSSARASSSRWRWSSSCRPTTAPQWFEYWCQERLPLVHRPRHPRGAAAPAPARPRGAVALLGRHVRRRVHVPVGLGRARGHRQPHRLRPHAARASSRARTSRTSTRSTTAATCRT